MKIFSKISLGEGGILVRKLNEQIHKTQNLGFYQSLPFRKGFLSPNQQRLLWSCWKLSEFPSIKTRSRLNWTTESRTKELLQKIECNLLTKRKDWFSEENAEAAVLILPPTAALCGAEVDAIGI